MIANTPSLKKDSKNLYQQDKDKILKQCKDKIMHFCGEALGSGDRVLFADYGKLFNNTTAILTAIDKAIEAAIEDETYVVNSIDIGSIVITIDNYSLSEDSNDNAAENMAGTSSTPLSFFSRSSTPRSPTPKGMFRTISGIGSCFGGSQRSSTSTSPTDFNLNGSPSPKP